MIEQTESANLDYRGIPTALCPCGSQFINIQAIVDPETYEIGFYLTEGTCAVCGSLLTVATPADKES